MLQLQGVTLQKRMQQLSVQNIIAYLDMSINTYYLTGSRFFGNFKEDSDWDFFAFASEETRRELVTMGFKRINCENFIDLGYNQDQFVDILELEVIDGVVQVQLVNNIEAKTQVQNFIKSFYLHQFNSMSKNERKELWTLLLHIQGLQLLELFYGIGN